MGRGADLKAILSTLAPIEIRKPYTGLYDVICDKELDLAREFVAAGHDPRAEFYGGTVVDLAVRHGDLDFIKFIIETGRPIDKGRQSILDTIIQRMITAATDDDPNELLSVLEYLLTQPINKSLKASAFRQCATYYLIEATKLIVKSGLGPQDPIYYDFNKTKPLIDIISEVNPLFVPVLCGENEDTFAIEEAAKENLVGGMPAGVRESLGELLDFIGVDKSVEDILSTQPQSDVLVNNQNDRKTALQDKILSGDAHAEQCEKLARQIRNGDWDDYVSKAHNSGILAFAAQRGLSRIAAAVLSRKPDDDTCQYAARQACIYGHLEILEQIRQYGTNITHYEAKQDTPLRFACEYGHAPIVKYLLELGANARSTDTNGDSMFKLAGGLKMQEIRQLLQNYSKDAKPEWRSGYAVKGKAKDWRGKQLDAVEQCINGWDTYGQLWIKAAFTDVVNYFTSLSPNNTLLDVKKNALPNQEGVFIYQLTDDEDTWVLPVYADRLGSLHEQVTFITDQAASISATLKAEVIQYIADDNSGCGIDVWKSGTHTLKIHEMDEDVETDSVENELLKRELLLIPSLLESNGFERRITFRNIKKSQIKQATVVM